MIKKYFQFIKENKSNFRDIGKPKNISKNFVEDIFLDFIDNDWEVIIEKEILERDEWEEEALLDRPILIDGEEEYVLGFRVLLKSTQNTVYDSYISRLEFMEKVIEPKNYGVETIVRSGGNVYYLDELTINNDNKFVNNRNGDVLSNEVEIYIYDSSIGSITAKELFEYYNLRYDDEDSGGIYFKLLYEDFIPFVSFEEYKDILEKGNVEYDYFHNLGELTQDDINGLIDTLNQENFYLMIDVYIDKMGSWDEFKNNTLLDLDIDVKTLVELKNFLYKKLEHSVLSDMEGMIDVIYNIDILYHNIHLKNLEDEAYRMVEESLENEVQNEYGGIVEWEEYKNDKGEKNFNKYFLIPYSNDMADKTNINKSDLEFITPEGIYDYVYEYISLEKLQLDVNEFPTYTNVDRGEFNEKVNEYLKKQL